jgi:hypothetical protein
MLPEINGILMDEKVINSFHILLHRQHQLAREKLRLLRLSRVKILPFAAVHKKKATREGALTFQILSQGKCSSGHMPTTKNGFKSAGTWVFRKQTSEAHK